MPFVVKITVDDDGVKRDNPKWCYVHDICGGNATLCSGEYFGYGESAVKYTTKPDGKINCPKCIEIIKKIKSVKL